ESIKSQHYPEKLITIFVVADGCTDNTALIAQRAGAKVYTRSNPSLVGKGYALNFLLNNIKEDYPSDSFEGYFVFDADNVLSENFVLEMNRTFSDGYEIVTGYRNSKNYGENWVSAGYALWFLRESKFLNNSRFLMNTSCAVSGTGFMFSDRILKEMGGWDFFLLTEDIEFSIYNVLHKNKI
ncbi:MAG: glycosyltransferase family 2 protein, partial [Oscillospiraceae bacterium]